MIWAVTGITFLAVLAVGLAVLYAVTPSEGDVAERLSRLLNASPGGRGEGLGRQKERAREVLASIGRLVPVAQQSNRTELMLTRAGYRSPDAILAVQGMRVILPIVLVGLVLFTGLYKTSPFLLLAIAAIAGYMIPEFWVLWRVQARQDRLRHGLPDALDLLVICVEVGLGLDQALLRVSQELRIVHRELSEELQMVNLEMRVGKTRIDALRELARRTGLEDIKALAAMLIQTERFGTSVAQSLRIHSDDLRTRRRQRAEEMSAKTTVKILPPLVFFIFPALIVVVLGPAILALMHQLAH